MRNWFNKKFSSKRKEEETVDIVEEVQEHSVDLPREKSDSIEVMKNLKGFSKTLQNQKMERIRVHNKEETKMNEIRVNVINRRKEQEKGNLRDANVIAVESDNQSAESFAMPEFVETLTSDEVCSPDTCTKDCFTCGPPAILRKAQDLSKVSIEKSKTKSIAASLHKSVRWNSTSKSRPLPSDIDVKPINQFILDESDEHQNKLIAEPLEGIAGTSSLGEALRLLMKQDWNEQQKAVSKFDMEKETAILKSPASSKVSSSEPSNTNLFESSHKSLHTVIKKELKAKSVPILQPHLVDESVNTSSLMIPSGGLVIDDSMVKLKYRSQLNEDSCTQYFALRSPLQIEPYLKDMRIQQAKQRIGVMNNVGSSSALNIVLHQKGVLQLSKLSVDTKVGQVLPDGNEEKELMTLDLDTAEHAILKPSLHIQPDDEQLESEESSSSSTRIGCRRCKVRSEGNFSKYSWMMSKTKSTLLNQEQADEEEERQEKQVHMRKETVSSKSDVKEEGMSQNLTTKSKSNSDELDELNDRISTLVSSLEDESDQQFILALQILMPSMELISLLPGSVDSIENAPSFVLKWNFLKYVDSCSFSLDQHEEDDNNIQLNYMKSYSFNISSGVYLYLLKCPMAIELYCTDFVTETLIGKCNLMIGRCFSNTSIIYESILEIQNNDLCLCYKNLKPMRFGELVCRYRLRGEQAKFDEFIPIKPPYLKIPPLIEIGDSSHMPSLHSQSSHALERRHSALHRHGMSSRGTAVVSEAELQAFQDGLNLVLVRNKALRTTQEEITNELKDRTTWMHEELKWRLTLQENAILCGKDPAAVKWRQWKDDTTANVRYRPISHEEYFKDGVAHIEIEILDLVLKSDCKAMTNDNLTHIYIEYAFLTFTGPQMETPTMRKPMEEKPIRFRFKKLFNINIDDNEAFLLADLIRNNETITFTIISQPIEDFNTLQSCYDFGVANLVLFELLQSRHNVTMVTVPVLDSYNRDITIGSLKIRFSGVLAMRSMALHLLTPDSFKVIR